LSELDCRQELACTVAAAHSVAGSRGQQKRQSFAPLGNCTLERRIAPCRLRISPTPKRYCWTRVLVTTRRPGDGCSSSTWPARAAPAQTAAQARRRPRPGRANKLKAFLDLQVLEDRVPVSEQIRTLVGLGMFSGAAALALQPRVLRASTREAGGGWALGNSASAPQLALVPAKASASAAQPSPGPSGVLERIGSATYVALGDDPLGAVDQLSLDLVSPFPPSRLAAAYRADGGTSSAAKFCSDAEGGLALRHALGRGGHRRDRGTSPPPSGARPRAAHVVGSGGGMGAVVEPLAGAGLLTLPPPRSPGWSARS
jgi:hypothetical protein